MELLRALGALAEPSGPQTARLAALLELPAPTAADWTELFVCELPPYASIYLGAEGMIGGEARDRIAGFWRALGLTPPPEPDHLTALLAFSASLAEAGSRESVAARRALFHEHLSSWLPPYLASVEEVAPPAYRAWGRLLAGALAAEAAELGPAERLPLHLREAPLLEHPDEVGLDAFVGQLLQPVRSGMIVTRYDLGRIAGELGLGLRAGGRRFALRSLVEQDPAGTLDWLAGLAQRTARTAPEFWRDRGTATAALLSSLGAAVEEAEAVGVR